MQDLNTEWAKSVKQSQHHKLPADFKKGRPVHVSIDNSDGKQQTLTGAHTTHYTNGTVFQLDTEDPTIPLLPRTRTFIPESIEFI